VLVFLISARLIVFVFVLLLGLLWKNPDCSNEVVEHFLHHRLLA
jgi:hypothetical protein